MASEATGPLSGVRVLEFSQIVAGPVCGINLADLGAEVIKVEPPGGEQTRRSGAVIAGEGKAFQALNRGKRSLVTDLHDPRARALIHRLMPGIDVVATNYRLGVAERMGIDYDTLRAIRPDVIYWQNTGFGEGGPEAQRAGSDIVAQAYSGLMVTDAKTDDDGAPDLIASPIADITTGFAAAMGICAALFHRERTGEGQRLGTSLLRTGLFIQGSAVMREPVSDAVLRDQLMIEIDQIRASGGSYGEILEARKGRAALRTSFRLYYGAYRASDGAVVLGALTKANRDGMRAVLGGEDERSDEPDYDAFAPANQAIAEQWKLRYRERFLTRTVAEWVAAFDAVNVPVAPVNLPEELADDPQVLADGMITDAVHTVTGPQRLVSPAVVMSKTPTAVRRAAPALAEHSVAVLREAGWSEDELAELLRSGVVVQREDR
ncbi:MAG: CoA transferase [Chloroflexi bacterium]|nr:CoA transferase [Chloroflexota bacterium]MDA1002937.1 CoA transferase [Chloroflexota bacterium]